MADHSELIGRADVNDLDAILAITNTDVDEISHAVRAEADAIFTWDYERSRPALAKLYEKAKTSQWNANDLPWDIEVDQEKVAAENQNQNGMDRQEDFTGTPFEKWGDKEWIRFGVESQNWTLSQFMHGEQGALICTAQIVETVPWVDAKYYAATQVMDEARHVEVFAALPRHEALGALPDQRAPRDAARRHHPRLAVGHDLPRDADHGRGPRARRVRVPAPDDHRAAPEEVAPLRHERRSPSCRVRCVVLEGVLPAAFQQPRSASVRSSLSKRPSACGIASCSRKRGSAWAWT